MTDSTTHIGRARGDPDPKFALVVASAAAAALSGCAAAAVAALGGRGSAATLAALLSLAGIAIGYLLGRRHGVAEKGTRMLMLRVADELAQYRAFTRLLRDQGARIVESTSGAAMMIVAGLNEMDATIDRMRVLVGRASTDDIAELRSLVEAVGAPVIDILGHLQFQDVTQQQIGFLSRLSLVLDDHMAQLARQLDERRAIDRVGRFKEMFDQALGDCVMDSQRDDHHAASGLTLREDPGSKLGMF
jgi:hypothetical protein